MIENNTLVAVQLHVWKYKTKCNIMALTILETPRQIFLYVPCILYIVFISTNNAQYKIYIYIYFLF